MNLKLDQSINEALKLVNDHSGQDYFEALVTSLAHLIHADYVLIGKIDLESHTAHSLALWCDGETSSDLSYRLEETPCDQVFSGGTCIYPRDIAEQFPKDEMLADFGLQGYVGRSLKNRNGEPIGLLVALFKQPDVASENILSIFDLFAIRASVELERLQWENTLQEQIELLKTQNQQLDLSHTIFEHTNEGILLTDHLNNIITVNAAFEKLSGYSKTELVGKNPSILSSGLQSEQFYTELWGSLLKTGAWQGELWNRRKDGSTYPIWSSLSEVKNSQGVTTHYIASVKDTQVEKELQEQLYHQATHDYLTGLSNRFEFHQHAQKAVAQANRNQEHYALLRINIDNLNLVNASYGHETGDLLVQTIGQRLNQCLARENDLLSRLGGDEFALLIGFKSNTNLQKHLKKITTLFRQKIQTKENSFSPSCSVGISILGEDACDLDTLLRNADKALRYAKENVRGSYSFYSADFDQKVRRQDVLQDQLFHAITKNQIEPYFQPIINLTDGSLSHCEALARWQDERLGHVAPDEFIPIAETTGLIQQLGKQIFSKATAAIHELNQKIDNPIGVTINRSPFEFSINENASNSDYSLNGLSSDQVGIEITENLMIESPDHAKRHLDRLKEQGFALALDDFGTGYSSLSYLKLYPFDYLKIDQSFIRDMQPDSDDFVLVKTIIQMAKNLGLKTIAEGIETEEQRVILVQLGCDYGQGYLFSKPIPKDAFEAFALKYVPA